ncbi:hypothetical protein ACQ4LE_003205 [Meloidogyne hapla]
MSSSTQIPSQSPAQHQMIMEQMKLNPAQNVGQTNSMTSTNPVNNEPVAKSVTSIASSSQNLKALLPAVPPQCGPPTVSLALLLDFAIHQTLHELQIISELNAKKKDQDRTINRTITVVQFAHSTRLIFVRLLAIVRWLKTNRKFEPLSSIRFLLDEQAARYVETADKLVEIARNELPNARLSVFHVPQAVDVLTLGTYPRLPQNIKDRFVSTPPLAGREQRLTLRELNRVLEFHLAQSSRQLSPRIEQISIKNGMVTLTVPNEFEIVLTRLGDDMQTTKWCLLNIKILVTNAEVGQGQRLVHPLQVNFLHQMVQERLDNGEKPLFDAYNLLHTFCRSLQLDVLYCQATLIAKISSLYIRVEEYNTKECKLVIAYWLGGVQQQQSQQKHFRSKKQIHHYRFNIYGDKTDPHSTLRVKHHPAGPELPKLDQSFSLQRLLNETILFRCRERLLQTQRILEQAQPKQAKITHSGQCLLSLTCPLILTEECLPAETLIISANTFFGTVNCRVEALGRRDEINELEKQLNATNPSIKIIVHLLDRLRILILMERLQRAIVGLQVRKLNDNQALPLANKLTTIPKDRNIFQFIREDQFYLIIAFMPDDQTGVKIQFHLFSSAEGRLTMLDLDADQIIRSAPLPRLYAASSISASAAQSTSSKSNTQRNLHNQRLSEFFQRYRKGKNENK